MRHRTWPCPEYGVMEVIYDWLIDIHQRRAAILCTGTSELPPSKLLPNYTGWDTLADRHKHAKLTQMLNMTKSLTPPYLTAWIPLQNQAITPYPLRNSSSFESPFICRTQSMSSSFILATMRAPNVSNPLAKLYSFSFCSNSTQHTQIRSETNNLHRPQHKIQF